jgi:hypothetical protein
LFLSLESTNQSNQIGFANQARDFRSNLVLSNSFPIAFFNFVSLSLSLSLTTSLAFNLFSLSDQFVVPLPVCLKVNINLNLLQPFQ